MVLKGSCYCGDIAYELDDTPDGGILCHCTTCQKLHTQNSYNIKSTVDKLKVIKGTPTEYTDDKSDSGYPIIRNFCGKCGSSLFSVPKMPKFEGAVFIKVGGLESASSIKPIAEIYCESALSHSILPKSAETDQFKGFMAEKF